MKYLSMMLEHMTQSVKNLSAQKGTDFYVHQEAL